jgi:hypothetical protein
MNPINLVDRFEANVLSPVEKIGNYLGLVRGLGTGEIRKSIGMVQVAGGISCAFVFRCCQALSSKKNAKFWEARAVRSLSHVRNGIGNIVRGEVEKYVFSALLTVMVYDFLLEKRVKYIGEVKVANEANNNDRPPPPYELNQFPPPLQHQPPYNPHHQGFNQQPFQGFNNQPPGHQQFQGFNNQQHPYQYLYPQFQGLNYQQQAVAPPPEGAQGYYDNNGAWHQY